MLAVLLVSDWEDSTMLEARLIAKLTEAKIMWDTPPYYRNDAQDVIKDAVSMAVDTEWENRISELMTECLVPYDRLKEQFLLEHPGATEAALIDSKSEVYWSFSRVCQSADKAYNDHVSFGLGNLIEWLCSTIGDKIHRRNLQIADLKRQRDDVMRRSKLTPVGYDATKEAKHIDIPVTLGEGPPE